jgi:Ca2+-binding RTX toxin-like protein
MKRAIFLLTTMALALVVASGTAWAFDCAAGSCWGTPQGDLMIGTAADQGLHGRGGDDLIRGKGGNDSLTGDAGDDAVYGGGNDKVNGGAGNDRVVGNKGDDRLLGDGGNDHVDGRDLGPAGIGGSDVLDCGRGFDTFEADFDDTVMPNCEKGVVSGF